MAVITYAQIRAKMDGEAYPMTLADEDEVAAVVEAVNQGIDSHLEICNSPEREDSYEPVDTLVGGKVFARKLSCVVSEESFPTLLRRLCELRLDSLGFTDEELCYGGFDIVAPVDEEEESNV